MSNSINMNNLYRGLGYEYYTASQLWKLGFEAYKMDADFGFDLMAYNQREKVFEASELDKIYLFQVKMRCDKKVSLEDTKAGKRKVSQMKFKMGENDFKRLLNEEKGYLICYFVEKTEENRDNILGEFWLSNSQLKYLYQLDSNSPDENEKFFKTDSSDEGIYIEGIINTKADPAEAWLRELNGIKELIESIDSSQHVKELKNINSGVDKLIKNINNASIVNENSQCNIYLLSGEKKNWLKKEQLDFGKFNQEIGDDPFRN